MNKPLLSICIPTYNRGAYLRNTLDSIIRSEGFCEDVEIVISDNASSDDTSSIGREYAEIYPNVKYFRNEENVHDFNFPLALDRGTGQYIKLNNDNRVLVPGGLRYMLDAVREHQDDHIPLFFTNRPAFNIDDKTEEVECNDLSDFVIHLSYYSTGIWIFGSWKEDWNKVVDKMKYSPLQLSQVDWFYQIICNKGMCLLKTKKWNNLEYVGKRTGYNWLQVHVDNYYTIMRPYYESGKISKKAYAKDHWMQLQRMKPALTTSYVHNVMPDGWDFDMSGATAIFWKNFRQFFFFYIYILTAPFWMLKLLIKNWLNGK